MISWPVFDPGSGGLGDLYPYEVEIDEAVDVEIDFQAAEEATELTPSAWLRSAP